MTYAHHLVLQLWAVFGTVGLAGAGLVAVATLTTLDRAAWSRLAPLLVALTLLNTWDLTLFEPEVALPALLAVAYWAARPRALQPKGRPRHLPQSAPGVGRTI